MKVLFPLPRYGFDPTESAVPWSYLRAAGHSALFATPDGKPARADRRMLTGEDLGIWKSSLMIDRHGAEAYGRLEKAAEFNAPIPYAQIAAESWDAVFLAGGHDPGMREYLGSPLVQAAIAEAFARGKPVGAICHGTLVVGRSVAKSGGKSVLYGRKTTGLTRYQELTPYYLTRSDLGTYYRTYPELDRGGKKVTMEDELVGYLEKRGDFVRGPGWPIPLSRDTPSAPERGFALRDGNYLSARWPGDAHRMGTEFVKLLD